MARSKILIAILGLDQHEVGAMTVAGALREAGMEVVYTGRFNLPAAIVQTALDEDVDVIGLSSHSWEYLYYIDDLLERLREYDLSIPVVLGGSVITPTDAETLRRKGVAAAFGSSCTTDEVVRTIRELAG
jgi:methylmalonyl-CoA mutase C-terminal domain/subunit